ncbi:hypothetical protein ABER75_11835 [Niallia taxi]|uniref:hypothetical protein n=1 Tax=Niallia taxi TaxID=2499688 RepID=UPI003D292AFA
MEMNYYYKKRKTEKVTEVEKAFKFRLNMPKWLGVALVDGLLNLIFKDEIQTAIQEMLKLL